MKQNIIERIEELETKRGDELLDIRLFKLNERIERLEKIIESMGYYIP